MRKIMTVAAVGFAFCSAIAGTPGFYISGEGGVSLLPDLTIKDTLAGKQTDSFDTGFAAGGAVSYDVGAAIRMPS